MQVPDRTEIRIAEPREPSNGSGDGGASGSALSSNHVGTTCGGADTRALLSGRIGIRVVVGRWERVVAELFKRAWAEVRHGHNIDLYLALFASGLFFLLGLAGIASEDVTLPLTLFVLGLVVYSHIGFRSHTEELGRELAAMRSGEVTASTFFKDQVDINDVIARIRKSRRVVLWGATLSAHVPFLLVEIRRALGRNTRVQVLLVSADGAAIETAAFRSRRDSVEALQRSLDNARSSLGEVAGQNLPGILEVRFVDYLPPYVLYAFDPDEQDGSLMIRLAGFDAETARPTFWLSRQSDEQWCAYFMTDFQKVWDSATPMAP
jgi:hypothetical protein